MIWDAVQWHILITIFKLHLSLVDVERPSIALLVIVDHGAEVARDIDTLAASEDAAVAEAEQTEDDEEETLHVEMSGHWSQQDTFDRS